MAKSPGTAIKQLLKKKEKNVKWFASQMKIDYATACKLLAGTIPLTEQNAMRLETIFCLGYEFWKNRHENYSGKPLENAPEKQESKTWAQIESKSNLFHRKNKIPSNEPIGTLKERHGVKGYHIADIGHPVYETSDRYVIYVEPLEGPGKPISISYYKSSLKESIDFL